MRTRQLFGGREGIERALEFPPRLVTKAGGGTKALEPGPEYCRDPRRQLLVIYHFEIGNDSSLE
jgi:hypothetical protein